MKARRTCQGGGRRASRRGFTLLELLVVIVIMFMIMGIGVGTFMGYTRGAALRGAISNVKGTLQLARQHAVSYQRSTAVVFTTTATNATYLALVQIGAAHSVSGNRIHLHNPLPWANGTLEGSVVYGYDASTVNRADVRDNRNDDPDPGLATPHWIRVASSSITAGQRLGMAIHARRQLPDGLAFTGSTPEVIFFNSDGTTPVSGDVTIEIHERHVPDGALVRLRVRGLTGWVEEL